MIWVLTAGFGDGHNTAARSVAAALRRAVPADRVVCSDLLAEAHPWAFRVLQWAYQLAIIWCPRVWQWLYSMLARPGICGSGADWLRPALLVLADRIATEQPRVIVSTFPMYGLLLDELRRQGHAVPPLVTILTDSISVHPIWVAAPSDGFLLPDEETLAIARLAGAQDYSERMSVSGFPVSLDFETPGPEAAATLRGRAGRVLYLPSTPAGHVQATLLELLPLLQQGIAITLVAGKHATRLYHLLRRFTDAHPTLPLTVLGWTDQIPRLLQSHDVVICKAGGAILHEALAACIPAVIDYVVPGQEEGNAELLLRHQCAIRSANPVATADAVRRMLADDQALARSMRLHMQPISKPQAARIAAEMILKLARSG